MSETQLLIIGAGPYGLAVAACAKERGLDFTLVGEIMGFWKHNMPRGMFLRSTTRWNGDWDPLNTCTFGRYIEAKGLKNEDLTPIPIDVFIGYGHWYQEQVGLRAERRYVHQLSYDGKRFEAQWDGGGNTTAHHVVIATGPRHFANVPPFARDLPPRLWGHTSEVVGFRSLKGKRCLIVGGRQSAFEWRGADE